MTTQSETVKLIVGETKTPFEILREVAEMSSTLTDLMGEDYTGIDIPVVDIEAEIMEKIIEYCTYRLTNPYTEDEEKVEKDQEKRLDIFDTEGNYDREFTYEIDPEILGKLFIASDYLQIESIMKMCAKYLAYQLKITTEPNDFCKKMNITPDDDPMLNDLRDNHTWVSEIEPKKEE